MLSPALVEAIWYGRHPLGLVLAPLSWLYAVLVAGRRAAYASGLLSSRRVGAPVVVVGNICVGGAGKTPLVLAVTDHLLARGWRPGIVCRGYRGRADRWPRQVHPDTDPREVGDEAVLLARRADCPVVAGPARVDAAGFIIEECGCNVVVSDDGLQHLALHRDVEIAVIDAVRQNGNGRFLPAGPLREAPSRLGRVDIVVENGGSAPGRHAMRLVAGDVVNLADAATARPFADFRGEPVHAVSGIAHPERFFAGLEAAGLRIHRHPFPDHHPFEAHDLAFGDDAPVLMTEKDAVKCARFAAPRHWFVPVRAELDAAFGERLDACLGPPPGPV